MHFAENWNKLLTSLTGISGLLQGSPIQSDIDLFQQDCHKVDNSSALTILLYHHCVSWSNLRTDRPVKLVAR